MSDRHPKWVRVERGTVIPAGQPWRVEYPVMNPEGTEAHESVSKTVLNQSSHALDSEDAEWFVDSSWKPPLDLPTEPTWGIVKHHHGNGIDSPKLTKGFRIRYDEPFLGSEYGLRIGTGYTIPAAQIDDFIPLTDEQVARIEAAR